MAMGSSISDVFSSSPFTLLEEHVRACAKCVGELEGYFIAAQEGDWALAAERQAEIAQLESIADDFKRQVRRNLPRGLWMSVSRADLLELVRMQDKMANNAKDVAGLSLGRELAFPKKLEKSVIKYIQTVVESVNVMVEVVEATRDLSRGAFGTRQAKTIMAKVTGVEKHEQVSDEMQSKLRAKLRLYEDKISPIDAMFLYQLLSGIGEIANSAEKAAHRAQIIANS
tara:strand:+ start:362 stop:1042 length:681 start_codon:yes stop_codon:yes gene_type:complete